MALGDKIYDKVSDKQWGSEVYRKAKEVIEKTLSKASGVVQFASICDAMKLQYPKLANDQIKAPWDHTLPYWKDRVSMALQQLKKEGKVVKYDSGWIWEEVKPPLLPIPAPTRHDELKQKMVDIGNKLRYNTSTEETCAGYRHDVLWKPGPYKRDPSHVIEICAGGSLPKDFDALSVANRELSAKGILVAVDDTDYVKAKQRFENQPDIVVVKAETVDGLHELMMTDLEFLKSIFSG